MPKPRERRWPGLVAGYVSLLLVLAAVTTVLYLSITDVYKAMVIRVAVVVLTGVVLIHIHSRLRQRLDSAPTSEFEQALRIEPSPLRVDPLLLKLIDELRFSVGSRRYFQNALWPRLVRLARRNGEPAMLEEPPAAWFGRGGPSSRALAELIERLEEQS